MIALVGALGFFHLAQQGVHFGQAELAAGAHRAVAGHGGQQLVAPGGGQLRDAVFAQFGEQGEHQRRRIGCLQERWNAAHGQLGRPDRRQIERGAVGLLTKPIDFALLRHEIDTRLGQAA